ncbi:MAG TPA: ABC transporter permease [Pseudacidobacterium sp.]|jgi:predicted permease|nr:ABC transporter permease [Pseudacidobacterium sp.]
MWWRKKNELDEEVAAHLRMAAVDRVERGEDADTARQQAEREFGNVALVKDVTREAWGWVWFERLLQDVRYALRQMRKSPGFAATVIATLALGIAAPAAMITVVDRVMLRPLPYKDSGRIVQLYLKGTDGKTHGPVYLDMQEWRKWSHSFESIGFYRWENGRNFLEGNHGTEHVGWYDVSANLFEVLGVVPEIGHDFRASKESFAKDADAENVVISDSAWRGMFGGDPSILGKRVKVSGKPFVVVGVMPRGFYFPFGDSLSERLQVWTLVTLSDHDGGRTDRTPRYTVMGRLRHGTDAMRAQAELSTLQSQIAKGYVDEQARRDSSSVAVESYAGTQVDKDIKQALESLLAAAGVLWLIACVNTTNLLLARAMVRRREIAVRGALGAGRRRIMQQLLVEGLLLSFCAGAIGGGLALITVKVFGYVIPRDLPLSVPAAPDGRIILGLLGLTVISALVSSVWPAWISAHAPVEPALKHGGMQSGDARGQNRLRAVLVVVEISLSLTLLVGCGLLLRTIYALRHVPLGFRTDHVIVANLQIPGYKFTGRSMADNLYMPLAERVKHLPGVQAAGLMSEVPLGKTFWMQMTLYGKQGELPGKTSGAVNAKFDGVSAEIQKIFGFRMLAGRYFNEQDTASSAPVLVVNSAFVHAYAPAIQDMRKAIGMELVHLSKEGKPTQIVGVVDDFRQFSVATPPQPEMNVLLSQVTPASGFYDALEGIAMDLVIRTDRDPKAIIPEIREVLRQGDPALAGSNFTTMDQVVEDSYGSQILAAHLLEIFGGSALLLCVAGLYGLLAYVVSQRTRELGIRLALGAQRGDLVWMVLRQASVMLVTGVVIGMGLALASGSIVGSYLYGVSTHDGWTLGAVSAVLVLSGLLAAYLPARRAAMVDPMEALRAE